MIIVHHSGRLGNTLLQDIGASILSNHYNLKVVNYWEKYGILNPKFNHSGRLIDSNKFFLLVNSFISFSFPINMSKSFIRRL